jgi:hypothetical protein
MSADFILNRRASDWFPRRVVPCTCTAVRGRPSPQRGVSVSLPARRRWGVTVAAELPTYPSYWGRSVLSPLTHSAWLKRWLSRSALLVLRYDLLDETDDIVLWQAHRCDDQVLESSARRGKLDVVGVLAQRRTARIESHGRIGVDLNSLCVRWRYGIGNRCCSSPNRVVTIKSSIFLGRPMQSSRRTDRSWRFTPVRCRSPS